MIKHLKRFPKVPWNRKDCQENLKNRGNTVQADSEVSENIKFALCISHSVEPREPREPWSCHSSHDLIFRFSSF